MRMLAEMAALTVGTVGGWYARDIVKWLRRAP